MSQDQLTQIQVQTTPEKSWLRQMANAHGIDPSLKAPPEVVIDAFLRKLTEWRIGQKWRN
jgi:hypothetical protein